VPAEHTTTINACRKVCALAACVSLKSNKAPCKQAATCSC
jgi:hypothetical protein